MLRVRLMMRPRLASNQIRACDPDRADTHFNSMVMGAPTSAAMLLGDSANPSGPELEAHALEMVRIFMSAYAMPVHGGATRHAGLYLNIGGRASTQMPSVLPD